tara:strand:+ start:708 stop:824 length:117 start_codon:yes stop_codon:yes gene_type:complete
VEMKKVNFVQLVMPVGELSIMAQQLKSTSAYFVMDETQ